MSPDELSSAARLRLTAGTLAKNEPTLLVTEEMVTRPISTVNGTSADGAGSISESRRRIVQTLPDLKAVDSWDLPGGAQSASEADAVAEVLCSVQVQRWKHLFRGFA